VGYDCKADAWNWKELWTPEKQGWCCKHEYVGCVERELPQEKVFQCKVQSKVQTSIAGPASNICLAFAFSTDGLRMAACKSGDEQTWSWQGDRLRIEYNYKCLVYKQGGTVGLGACGSEGGSGGGTSWTSQGTRLQPAGDGTRCLTRSDHPSEAPFLAICDGKEAQVWNLKQSTGWAAEEADWCCRRRSIGCQTTSRAPPPPTTSTTTRITTSTTAIPTTMPPSGVYQCTGSSPTTWSAAQLLWCCLNGHPEVDASCPKHVSSLAKESYDCTLGSQDWRNLWGPEKQTWCCVHAAVGCTLASLLPEVPASGGKANPSQSAEQQEEEAEAFGLLEGLERSGSISGTPGGFSPSPSSPSSAALLSSSSPSSPSRGYDCLGSSPSAWTVERRLHCCSFEEIGCPQVSQPQQQQQQWQQQQQQQSGASPAIVGGTGFGGYDCRKEAVASWTQSKRSWCCDRQGLGCDAACEEIRNPNQATREMCCRTEHLFCETRTTLPANFDCSSGVSWSWSNDKALYCCRHEQKGCEYLPREEVDRLAAGEDAGTLGRSAGEAFLAVLLGPWQWLGNLVGLGGESGSSSRSRQGNGNMNMPLSTTQSFSDLLTTTTVRFEQTTTTTTTYRLQSAYPAVGGSLPPSTTRDSGGVTFQCFSGLSSTWSSRQLAWCCIHYGKGCEVLSESMPGSLFTCTDSSAMSVGKATWCCKHQQLLCQTPEAASFPMKYETPHHREAAEGQSSDGHEEVKKVGAFVGFLSFAGLLVAGSVVWRHHRFRCNSCRTRRRGLRMLEVLDYEFEEVVLL